MRATLRRLKFLGTTLCIMAALAAAAQAEIIQFKGDTNDSGFGIGTWPNLTYTPASFDVNVSTGDSKWLDLVIFTLSPCTPASGCTLDFGTSEAILDDFFLRIKFEIPDISGVHEFGADIYGRVVRNSSGSTGSSTGAVTFNFDNNLRTLTYANGLGAGSFDLFVGDAMITVTDPKFNVPISTIVTGQISNLTFTPFQNDQNVIPEPGSVVLLFSVLALTGASLRRRFRA
jgi:hypothetical protein